MFYNLQLTNSLTHDSQLTNSRLEIYLESLKYDYVR